ncbi:PREDICTED: uncharacterized protein LOC108968311 [Bactrocera latifrons]|uniref:uncharacterized protein LOC108968311 n=1 Tax=Bactrocera latifrons TaxID=174628 RepID=UPI0008DE1DD2|nr:PREDICTED: uncharacterized protein LOC108968311 [Bactrocera latifrons]
MSNGYRIPVKAFALAGKNYRQRRQCLNYPAGEENLSSCYFPNSLSHSCNGRRFSKFIIQHTLSSWISSFAVDLVIWSDLIYNFSRSILLCFPRHILRRILLELECFHPFGRHDVSNVAATYLPQSLSLPSHLLNGGDVSLYSYEDINQQCNGTFYNSSPLVSSNLQKAREKIGQLSDYYVVNYTILKEVTVVISFLGKLILALLGPRFGLSNIIWTLYQGNEPLESSSRF